MKTVNKVSYLVDQIAKDQNADESNTDIASAKVCMATEVQSSSDDAEILVENQHESQVKSNCKYHHLYNKTTQQLKSSSYLILGDFMTKGIRSDLLTKAVVKSTVNIKTCSGATVDDIEHYMVSSVQIIDTRTCYYSRWHKGVK